MARPALAGVQPRPAPMHPQVDTQRPAAFQPHEHLLAVRVDRLHAAPREVGQLALIPELDPVEHAPRQLGPQRARHLEDVVAFGHGYSEPGAESAL